MNAAESLQEQIRVNDIRMDRLKEELSGLVKKKDFIEFEITQLEDQIDQIKTENSNLSYEINSR